MYIDDLQELAQYRSGDRSPSCGGRWNNSVALSSSTGSAGPLPVVTTLFADPINVVTTTVNVRSGGAINLLIFTGIVSLPLGISVTLNFEILRSINNGPATKVGSTYTFSTLVDILESESFAFQFADSAVRAGAYTYTIQISTNSIVDITPGVTVNNATLSVLSVG